MLVIVIVAILLTASVLYFVLRKILPPTNFEERKDFIDLYTKIIGATALIVSLLFTWYSTENTLRITTETLRDAQRKELAERFAKANEQIGSESITARTGAIYSLGQLSNDSVEYYWPVMQDLTDLIRGRAPYKEGEEVQPRASCPVDIQAAMNVIGWRKLAFEKGEDQRLELRETDLRKLILKDKEKGDGTTREGAHLEGAQLVDANLEEANLRGAHFEGAILQGANLKNAYLAGAHFSNTTDLAGATLECADLGQAEGLKLSTINVARDWHKIKSPPKDTEIRAEWENARPERERQVCK